MAHRLQVAWHEVEATLKKRYLDEKDHQNRTRLQALWFLRQGRTMDEVAELIGNHPRTIQDWVAWYRKGGVADVLRHRHGGHGGKEPRLTPHQESELKALAEKGEIRTIWDGVQWVQDNTA